MKANTARAAVASLAIIVLLFSGCTQNGYPSQNGLETTSVKIENFAFSPQTIKVSVGDTVTWTNTDNVAHTVTSDSGSELDSELLPKSKSYTHTFSKAGTYDYHCAPHPYMKGTVMVK